MKRDTLITLALVIAGIVLAFILFGAGAFWKGRATSPRGASQVTPRKVVPVGESAKKTGNLIRVGEISPFHSLIWGPVNAKA